MGTRNLPKWLWNLFKNSFGYFKQESVYVGKDHLGNKYFEKSADCMRNLKAARWVEPNHGDQFVAPYVPVEWEAWLRRRRFEPPSQREIDRNNAIMMRTLKRAHEGQMRLRALAKESEEPETITTTKNPFDDETAVDTSKFPEYPEYEIIPGKKKDEK